MPALGRKNLFDPELVSDLLNKVKGKSSLAVLSKAEPIPFNGMKEFVFSMDKEIDIVAENGKKTEGGITVTPVTVVPIKFEYGARVSDEFMYASEEERINIVKAFNDGFAKKVARGLDISAILGLNPRTKLASDVVGNNCFAKAVSQTVTYESATADVKIEDGIATVEGTENDVTGIIVAPSVRSDLSKLTNTGTGEHRYPDFAFGGKPSSLGNQALEINSTVSYNSPTNKMVGLLGDFNSCFKWGVSKQIPLEVIEYGDPDNTGVDLKGSNQVYLRTEIYLGWAILDNSAFAKLETE